MRTSIQVSAALLGILSLAGTAAAQSNSGSIQATANVLAPINVTAGNTLDFGSVLPGVNKTIAPTDGTAGTFSLTGAASTPVNMTFTLPVNLVNGGNNLPITSWAGETRPTAAGAPTPFTPSGAASTATTSAAGQLFIFLGATVQPTVAQAAGVYTGTITMTVVY